MIQDRLCLCFNISQLEDIIPPEGLLLLCRVRTHTQVPETGVWRPLHATCMITVLGVHSK